MEILSVAPHKAAPTPDIIVEVALLGILAALWGASFAFIKLGVATIPPLTLIAARSLIAALVLLAIMRHQRIAIPNAPAIWRLFVVQTAINTVIPYILVAYAERTVEASLATILSSTSPIFAFLMTWTLTRHEAVTWRKAFGVVAGLSGTCLIVGTQAVRGLGYELFAQLALVLASISYAAAAIVGTNFRSLHPLVPAAGSLACGAALMIPASLVVDQPWRLQPSLTSILALLALSVFSTALAFVIYFRLIRTLGSVGTTAQAYLRVPIGVAISVFLLGETLSSTVWAGFACVIAGVAAMTIPARGAPRC